MDIRRPLPADLPTAAAALAGVTRQVGRDHGRWIDVAWLRTVPG